MLTSKRKRLKEIENKIQELEKDITRLEEEDGCFRVSCSECKHLRRVNPHWSTCVREDIIKEINELKLEYEVEMRGESIGVSYGVVGLKPITEDYKKRLNILNSCKDLGIRPPKEIEEYFEYDDEPCEDNIVVGLCGDIIKGGVDSDRCIEFYDVDLTQLPEGITKLRFEVSY